MQKPYDMTSWPCQTPDLFWALSDDLHNIGSRIFHDEDFVEYEIEVDDLPEGQRALWKINALRNIRVNLPREFEDLATKASLCLGNSTLQCIDLTMTNEFSMFTEQNILPFYVLDEPLLVRIEFRNFPDNSKHLIPRRCIDATGLLVRVKDKQMPFFIASSNDSILTYDGFKTNVNSRATSETLYPRHSTPSVTSEVSEDGKVLHSKWTSIHDDSCDHEALWNALKIQ